MEREADGDPELLHIQDKGQNSTRLVCRKTPSGEVDEGRSVFECGVASTRTYWRERYSMGLTRQRHELECARTMNLQ